MDQHAVKKIANLAKIQIREDEIAYYQNALNKILALEEKMLDINTAEVEPLYHPLELTQKLREDIITEHDQRELLQSIAPSTVAGLYLVPKVIE